VRIRVLLREVTRRLLWGFFEPFLDLAAELISGDLDIVRELDDAPREIQDLFVEQPSLRVTLSRGTVVTRQVLAIAREV
jgi:hypothetical protein